MEKNSVSLAGTISQALAGGYINFTFLDIFEH
jgi:hypothetical protein